MPLPRSSTRLIFSSLQHSHTTLPCFSTVLLPRCQHQVRQIRTKGRPKSRYSVDQAVIDRDAELLAMLEGELVKAKARQKTEEDRAKGTATSLVERFLGSKKKGKGKAAVNGGPQFDPAELPDEIHNMYFWQVVMDPADRNELERLGIKSLDELYKTAQAAQFMMSKPPYPSLQALGRKYKRAVEINESIPSQLARMGSSGQDGEAEETTKFTSS